MTKNDPQYPIKIRTDGIEQWVEAGQHIGFTGNSGFPKESTGPHLHIGLVPCDKYGSFLYPYNGYGGCINPERFLSTIYAQDLPMVTTLYQKLVGTLTSLVSLMQSSKGKS